jgi:hypothetical protein
MIPDRIVVPILIQRMADIMTINIVREDGIAEGVGAWPIFQDSRESLPGRDISVLTVQVRTTQDCSLDEAARHAVSELQRIIGSAQERPLEVALFVAHGTAQRNSPLVLRRDLWTSLQAQYGLPSFSRTYEHLVYRSQNGHRKAGVAILSCEELEATAPGLRRLRSAALLLADHGNEPDLFPLDRLFELAFGTAEPTGHVEWGQFVPGCLDLGLLPVRVVGEFDDREVEVDIFAGQRIIDALGEAAS